MKQQKLFSLKSLHLTKDSDLEPDEIRKLYVLTDLLKKNHIKAKQGNAEFQETGKRLLTGKTLGMIFEKSSTRTRVSFQVGMYQLGGEAIYLASEDTQLGRGESLEDTAQVLSGYLDGIVIRTFSQKTIDTMANFSRIPVINGLSDAFHPCQALTDFYTIKNRRKHQATICYIGDCLSNVAVSLSMVGSMLGHRLIFCSPEKYQLPEKIYISAKKKCEISGGSIIKEENPQKAVKDIDFIYTDVWVSMGKEAESRQRIKDFQNYSITVELLKNCKEKPFLMHCLPAHWGQEISTELKNYQKNIMFEQAENRLHVQKAILVALLLK